MIIFNYVNVLKLIHVCYVLLFPWLSQKKAVTAAEVGTR